MPRSGWESALGDRCDSVVTHLGIRSLPLRHFRRERARRYQCHCCGVAAASTCINAFYSTGGRRKTAREGRAEQRAADGYLKILSLAEQEVQYNDAEIYNTGLDRDDLRWVPSSGPRCQPSRR